MVLSKEKYMKDYYSVEDDLEEKMILLNEKDKEIERLNNVINELERHLEQQWLEWKDDSSDEIAAMANEDKCILEKLKKLKGGIK